MMYSPQPMHIPDGFLSVLVSIILWVLSIIAIGYALRRVGQDLGERQVPLMGVLAAAIFAGQMLNFTVAGGTSGHLLGATLATILLGPWAAIIVMTTVVGIQALIFQDGGLLAMGGNIFNMAIIGVSVSYFAYTSLKKLIGNQKWGLFVNGFVTAWLSIFIASLAAGLELAASGTSPANIAVPAMGGIHALIGKAIWLVGLGIAILLTVFSPLASAHPDGLEWVAEQKGFLDVAQAPLYKVIPDYVFPGITNEAMATIIAGILGTLIVFGVALGVAYTRRTQKTS